MKKQTKTKAKSGPVKRSSKKEESPELPDLVSVMLKVAERLEGLEKKIEIVLSQIGRLTPQPRPQETRSTVYSAPQHSQGQSSQYGNQNPARQQPNFQSNQQNQNRHQPSERRERPLYKTVCADCRKDCEIPFKPTGDRPVYCKECFAQRKNKNAAPNHPPKNNPGPHLTLQQKSVKVIPNGVGKVTISEMLPSAAPKRKSHKPVKKSR